ncbi:TlpA family protein disulfide reductase [Chitinophaga niabensis]|uniref:Thiol-disulfide isomerase or thioredoxin n=1 Tax=Chitinophaga niabensis TaxID=536979 RepID=A0A1N6D524_9BACT|nr:TlpA disulfide reductase family protein [Chitinophaga niabensis]SIN65833.1 Thiol-disulfide isomerase or thioredoxin [Chitinophaga niabensis]
MVKIFWKVLLFLAFTASGVKAQGTYETGDIFNEKIIGPVVNYHKDSLSFSEHKGKMLLIDFWATWCGPCIAEFPKLDSLQKKYEGDLQIILVTNEPREKIETFFKNNKTTKNISLPSIVEDNRLSKMFKHAMIPHEIWINDKDSIIAITDNTAVTTANIEKFLKGDKFSFKTKKDNLDYDGKKPYLINNNGGGDQKIFFNSVLAGRNESLSSFMSVKKDNSGAINGFTAMNVDLLKMLIVAYGKLEFKPTIFNRIFLNVKDSSLLDIGQMQEKKLFCYDLTLPSFIQNRDSIFQIMQQDLRRAFPFYGKVEKRNIDCWVLHRTSSKDKIKSKGGEPLVNIVSSGKRQLINSPISILISTLNSFSPRGVLYLVDQTNYSDNVDIDLGNEPLVTQTTMNISTIQTQLKKYDLDLVKKKALVDVLVIYQD